MQEDGQQSSEGAEADERGSSGGRFMTNSSDEQGLEESISDVKLKNQKAYVPVALVICTEIENHDIFRDILIEMFDSIREPASKQQTMEHAI